MTYAEPAARTGITRCRAVSQPAVRKGCSVSEGAERCSVFQGRTRTEANVTSEQRVGASASRGPSARGKLRHRQRERLTLMYRARFNMHLFSLGTTVAYYVCLVWSFLRHLEKPNPV